jgi:dienelactone hydrolase
MLAISVAPPAARLDEPIAIEVSGAKAGSHVHLQVRNHTLKAEAVATFVANERGTVNVATDAPIEGDYEGVEPAGLFWSARFDAGSDAATMIAALSSLEPLAYTATARVDESDAVQVDFTRTLLAPHVYRTPVRDGRLRGTLFIPKDAASAPAVIVLGGSDGGDLYTFVAAMLAAHGMTTLSLAYFGSDDLPPSLIEIPVEYFTEAVAWLKARTGADDRRVPLQPDRPVGILGFSRGAEAALLTAANCPDLRAVVALVPGTLTGGGISGSDFTAMAKPAWTFEGKPLPLLPPAWDPESKKDAQEAFSTGTPLAARPGILRSLDAAGSRVEDVAIHVEQTHGAILLMSGEDDQLWPSSRFAEIAMQRLNAASFPHAFEHRRYPDAGHFACLPPNLPARTAAARHALIPMSFAFGGSPRGNAAASADLWPRIVEFLLEHLASREPYLRSER